MSLEDICNVHGHATFCTITDEELESLVHHVRDTNGFGRIHNPGNHDFFLGIFDNDKKAARIIESIKECVLNRDFGDKFLQLSLELDWVMPRIEGTRYALTFEQAFYLMQSHRPMDDIYVMLEQQMGDRRETVLIKYTTGEYAS